MRDILARVPGDFGLYSGDDETGVEFMLAGGHGVISVTNNVAPKAMAAMCEAALAGDRDRALELNRPLEGLHHKLFLEANPIPVKWAMHQMGFVGPGIRLPLTVLARENHQIVRDAMVRAGAL